jgi:hypothetical protein
MALYLQMDGVDDKVQTPSITFTKIIFDVLINSAQVNANYTLIDARTGSGLYESNYYTGFAAKLNGTSTTALLSTFPKDTKINIELSTSDGLAKTDDVNIFQRNNNTYFMKGHIYNIKFYNGATLQAHYDMSTGTVQDQSGNGRHATLTGGTWLDDGVGGGAVDTTVSAVSANANASGILPSITTTSSVSATITGMVASASTSALIPQVGSNTNIAIQAISANATTSAMVPNIETARTISIGAAIAQAVASAISPNVVSGPLSVQITSVIASLQAEAWIPLVSIRNTIIRVIALHGNSPSSIQLKGMSSSAIHINGSVPSTIHLKGGIQ